MALPTLESILIALDWAVQGAGALVILLFAVRAVRSRAWREPFPGLAVLQGPDIIQVAAILMVYVLLAFALQFVVQWRLAGAAGPLETGSRAWHAAYAADSTAKLVACVLIIGILRTRPGAAFSPPRLRWHQVAILAVPATLAILVATSAMYHGLVWLWRVVEPGYVPDQHAVLEALQDDPMPPVGTWHLFAQAVLVAPLVEELFFRGLLLEAALRYLRRPGVAIATSAVLFGLVHYGVPMSVLPLTAMGLALGYLRVRYGSLGMCIAVHVLFNLRTMLYALLAPDLLNEP
ncbi:MAG: CPBP family intramembrane metalloprotease [Phycisphaerae bacterium]|nr:CPBP family intramembrane metalloprotease [Phycisphaerae bacterium]MCZ2399134.1 CPBP family intramembrane metalloprotease [Phycisphaerae bacterium]NUQ50153.1 CPBP family intramembrane metalloprotease [Phycisphaerae bacterium]